MFNYLFYNKKKENQFDLEASYMRIQFLTEDEKVKKDSTLKQLQKQFQNDFETIVPYESSFQCSHRMIFNSGQFKGKILLSELMVLLEATSDEQFHEFYEINVEKIKLHMKNNKLVSEDAVLQLYNERDVSIYNPPEVLEIIFVKKGFFDRLKKKSVKFVKGIPKYFSNFVVNIFFMFLRWIGINKGQSLISKFFPFKIIIQWALNFLMIFFPALAPVLGVGKMLI